MACESTWSHLSHPSGLPCHPPVVAQFGNLPFGFRSNTWLVPPPAAASPSSFPPLPVEDPQWGGSGGGCRGTPPGRHWPRAFAALARMACATPEERLARDRKAFLLHSQFVDCAVRAAVDSIAAIVAGRSQASPAPAPWAPPTTRATASGDTSASRVPAGVGNEPALAGLDAARDVSGGAGREEGMEASPSAQAGAEEGVEALGGMVVRVVRLPSDPSVKAVEKLEGQGAVGGSRDARLEVARRNLAKGIGSDENTAVLVRPTTPTPGCIWLCWYAAQPHCCIRPLVHHRLSEAQVGAGKSSASRSCAPSPAYCIAACSAPLVCIAPLGVRPVCPCRTSSP